MDRLTDKELANCLKNGSYMTYNKYSLRKINTYSVEDYYCKLSECEDIEEELGIDLVTLFKTLKEGVYVYSELDGITGKHSLSIDKMGEVYIDECGYYSIFDYGKTWALTREELENG